MTVYERWRRTIRTTQPHVGACPACLADLGVIQVIYRARENRYLKALIVTHAITHRREPVQA